MDACRWTAIAICWVNAGRDHTAAISGSPSFPSILRWRPPLPPKAQYEWGHYGNDLSAMEQDFSDRVKDYQRLYHVGIVQTEAPGLYKYYSTQRPVDIGTFPKPPHNAPDEIVNYDRRIPVEGGAFLAWGHLTYTRPLTEKEASDYELRPAPVISELSRKNDDRPLSIAQQMKEAGALAEASRGDPVHKKKTPDRGNR